MRHRLTLAALMAAVTASAALAHSTRSKHIEIVHPWMMETDGPSGAVSMKIRNAGKEPDRLVAVRCPGAATATLVLPQSQAVQGTAGVAIPAGGEAVLSASGAHLRIDGLTSKLSAYDNLKVELVFERAGSMAIEVMVEERGN